MQITYNGLTALKIMRALRSSGATFKRSTALIDPNCSPKKRWTRSCIDLEPFGVRLNQNEQIHVAVSRDVKRIQAQFAHNTIYSTSHRNRRHLLNQSFVCIVDGIALSSPELLFYELSTVMKPEVHILLGYELCGCFSRDCNRPRTGPITYEVNPLTTTEKLQRFLDSMPRGKTKKRALYSLQYIENNAWSPMEALMALMLELPMAAYGYEMGPVALNQRYRAPAELVQAGCATSRVPDIELLTYGLGLNYDGRVHLELEALRDAVETGDMSNIEQALTKTREKYVDDLRRNRELAAYGLTVFPVTSEDIFSEGGFDLLVTELLMAYSKATGQSVKRELKYLQLVPFVKRRQQLIWSLLPWDAAPIYSAQFEEALQSDLSHVHIEEYEIEF